MPYGGRYINEEQSFLVDNNGYRFTLKEKPDLESLTVLAKRDRTKKKGGYVFLLVLGFLTLPLFFIGIIFFICAYIGMTNIDKNNERDYECVYYNEDKHTVIFCSLIESLWLEFDLDRVQDVYNKDTNDIFGLKVNISDNKHEDNFYFKIGYATKEEKLECSKKLKRIKESLKLNDF